MVCRQLAAKGGLSEEALWAAIEGAITERVTEGMAAAAAGGCSVREAHIAWVRG